MTSNGPFVDETSNSRAPGWSESDRLAALEAYRVMDTAREPQFDDIVRIAAQICAAPMALISLVDGGRQWFKAAVGVEVTETPRDIAFCVHAIQQTRVMVVEDATLDDRFKANPLVNGDMHLRFYAGAPLETPEGLPLGTLCVLDHQPRSLGAEQLFALQALARQVVAQLELRKVVARQRSIEERHRRILESAVDYAIITMDLTGLVTSWSEGAHRILGWSEADMCGRPCDDFFTAEDRANGIPEREMGTALAHGRGSDERWHLRKDGSCFWASGEMMPLNDETGAPAGLLKILRDRTEFRQSQEALLSAQAAAEADRRLLTGELEHRVKNTLAIVQAIVGQTLRIATTPKEAARTIDQRLVALARANDILVRTDWAAAPISAIIAAATDIHGAQPHRISATGPEIKVGARSAVGLALALHELCTNAAKYGALSNDFGRVTIEWTIVGEDKGAMFELVWREQGGPAVSPPTRKGFGTKLIQASLSGGQSGKATIEYNSTGVVFCAQALLSAISEE